MATLNFYHIGKNSRALYQYIFLSLFKLHFHPSNFDHMLLSLLLLGRQDVTKGSGAQRSQGPGNWEQRPVGIWAAECQGHFLLIGKATSGTRAGSFSLPPYAMSSLSCHQWPDQWLNQWVRHEGGVPHQSAQRGANAYTHYCHGEGSTSDLPIFFKWCYLSRFLCEGANSLRIDTDTSFGNTVYKLDKTFPWTSRLYLGF